MANDTDDMTDLTEVPAHLVQPAMETTDFDFAAYLLTLKGVKVLDLKKGERKPSNPGMGYKFMFILAGKTRQEFNRLELSYVSGACTVEPSMYMQVRTNLRSIMDRRIRQEEYNRQQH